MSSGGSARRCSAAVDPQRVGRPARLPEDHSSWDAEVVDAGARTGWLHLSNRAVLGLTRADLRAGLEAMTDHAGAALVADPSRVSRWETGRQQPPVEVTLGYERLLGLPAGRLLAPVRALQRATGHAPTGVPADAAQPLEGLLERALDGGAMDGGRWLRLAMALAWHDRFFLRAGDAEEMAARLVSEVARTAGSAHHLRLEAALTLLQHPSSQRSVLRAVGAWLTDPDVQLVTPVVALLGSVGGDTDDLVVRLLQGQDSRVAEATLPVAAAKLAAGQVGARHLGDLADLAAQLVPVLGGRALADLLDLVCQLPREHFDRVVRAQRDGGVRDQLTQIRGSSTLIPDAAHRRLARSLAWRAQWGAEDREPPEPDQMLERLVREALFHVDGRRRELAGRLVAATPYGPVLATHVVALTDDPRELLATRAWELVHVLGHGDAHRSVVTRALDDSAPHRTEALLALGLSDVPLTPSEARAVSAVAAQSPDLRYAATLALALASPDSLPALRGLDAVTDRALDWWHRAGPQVVDPM